MVCMFGPTSDEYCLLHRGTRVRKMHSSYRSTFRTLGDVPLAMIDPDRSRRCARTIGAGATTATSSSIPTFEEKVTILYYYPATCSPTSSMR
jgi:glutamyl-tRNA(Gln) amidotransferase subunit D